jgi:hypothetical protein
MASQLAQTCLYVGKTRTLLAGVTPLVYEMNIDLSVLDTDVPNIGVVSKTPQESCSAVLPNRDEGLG